MNLPPSHRRGPAHRSNPRAFTLIELLVVISIIAVLAGLLLPVISNVMVKAKGVETKNTAVQIVTAIKSFQTDYATYPVYPVPAAGAAPTDYAYLPTASNADLFSILKADNGTASTTINTRRIRYFEGKDAKSASLPKGGYVPSGAATAKDATGANLSAGDLVDSFGMRFGIRVDSGYTDAVYDPYSKRNVNDSDAGTEPPTDTTVLHFGVIVWSFGNDNTIGKKNGPAPTATSFGDDIVSWQ